MVTSIFQDKIDMARAKNPSSVVLAHIGDEYQAVQHDAVKLYNLYVGKPIDRRVAVTMVTFKKDAILDVLRLCLEHGLKYKIVEC